MLCKALYNVTYISIASNLHEYLRNIPKIELEKIDEDFRLNAFCFIDFENEYNTKEIIDYFNYFFHVFGRFPSNLDSIKIPQGEIPKFIKTNDVISSVQLYQKFNASDCRDLFSVSFFVALYVFLDGDAKLSKNAMKELFSNLPMQALSKTDDSILLSFVAMEKLAANINTLLENKIHYFNEKNK